MTELRVVGAGLGRTGTHSLQLALAQLLGGPCYHMIEVFGHPEHVALWHAAIRGESIDWDAIFDGYAAAVDWPTAAFWHELAERNPEAIVLLSTRSSADAWWTSASATILDESPRPGMGDGPNPFREMAMDMFRMRFTEQWNDETAAKAAYEAHNDSVRRTAPADRLVEWQPGDGWEPLCAALGVAVPDAPFPHVNTTADFRQLQGLDGPS